MEPAVFVAESGQVSAAILRRLAHNDANVFSADRRRRFRCCRQGRRPRAEGPTVSSAPRQGGVFKTPLARGPKITEVVRQAQKSLNPGLTARRHTAFGNCPRHAAWERSEF